MHIKEKEIEKINEAKPNNSGESGDTYMIKPTK